MLYTLYWRKSLKHDWNQIGHAEDINDFKRQAYYMRRDDPTGLIAYSIQDKPSLPSNTLGMIPAPEFTLQDFNKFADTAFYTWRSISRMFDLYRATAEDVKKSCDNYKNLEHIRQLARKNAGLIYLDN